ncbi:CBS domain-containing protein [Candidatus Nitrososphaera gargensis]|nr:CBS domain-containing protein [Candidatus Nitrososphaera gargensis]
MYQEYADKKAGDIAERDILVMDESAYVADAARAMRQKGVSSVLVSRKAAMEPIGIITERDILYRLVAEHRSPFKTVLKDVMSSPLIVVDESATVKDAIVLMRKNGIRRMPVTKEGKVVGMLTLKSVVGDSREKSIELIDVELPATISKVACPYCGSRFENKQDLSKHIDRLHLGSGLLEGDLRQW